MLFFTPLTISQSSARKQREAELDWQGLELREFLLADTETGAGMGKRLGKALTVAGSTVADLGGPSVPKLYH